MAKVVKIKVKNAEGLYDNLIPRSASIAEYGVYASLDTSKGTIEERLTKLGKKEGSITSSYSTTQNELYRQGNYVIGVFKAIGNFDLYTSDRIIGNISEPFRPSTTQEFLVGLVDSPTPLTGLAVAKCSISTSGVVTLDPINFHYPSGSSSRNMTLEINFGYEANPL